MYLHQYLFKLKTHDSSDVEISLETHICKLHVILRSRVLLLGAKIILQCL